jgi:type III secretion protein L
MPDALIATPLPSLPRTPGQRIIRAADAQNWLDGYRFVEDARRAADALTQSAQTAYDDAKARGFEEGRIAGAAEAATIVAGTCADVDRYLASIESQLIELSVAITEQVIGRLDDADIVARAARHALASFRREKHLKIRVAPQLVDEVQQALSESLGPDSPERALIVESDAKLGARQCTIISEFAVVDASLDAQLDIVRRMAAASGENG